MGVVDTAGDDMAFDCVPKNVLCRLSIMNEGEAAVSTPHPACVESSLVIAERKHSPFVQSNPGK